MSKFIFHFDRSIVIEAESKEKAKEALFNKLNAIGIYDIGIDDIKEIDDFHEKMYYEYTLVSKEEIACPICGYSLHTYITTSDTLYKVCTNCRKRFNVK